MKKLITFMAFSALSGFLNAAELSFKEAESICAETYSDMKNIRDDGSSTFMTPNRVNVAFERFGGSLVCSVGTDTKEIEEVSAGRRVMGKQELKEAVAKRKAREAENAKIASGDYKSFIEKSKKTISNNFKDPESVRFRNLILSNKKLPTLCGEVNAKNSYGAYVGYKGFIHSSISTIIDDGNSQGEGFVYRKMYETSCLDKFAEID